MSILKYRESSHKTVKWETEYTVSCEIVLFQKENRDIAKNSTMPGIEIFHNQSYREISPMWGSLMRGLPVCFLPFSSSYFCIQVILKVVVISQFYVDIYFSCTKYILSLDLAPTSKLYVAVRSFGMYERFP